MASDCSDALRSLSDSADRLNALTDEAGEAIFRVEGLLSKLSLGIEVFVPFGDQCEKPELSPRTRELLTRVEFTLSGLKHRCLGYVRAGKERQYRIVVRDHDGRIQTWSELSRDLKIESVTALPNLVLLIAEEVQNRVAAAETALAEVSRILPNVDQS